MYLLIIVNTYKALKFYVNSVQSQPKSKNFSLGIYKEERVEHKIVDALLKDKELDFEKVKEFIEEMADIEEQERQRKTLK